MIVLLRRFPRLRRPSWSWPVVPFDTRYRFPDLRADFEVLDKEVAPQFLAADAKALILQNRFRLQQVLFLGGATLIALLSVLQAVVPGPWLGIGQAVAALTLAYVSFTTAGDDAREQATINRLRAERLRAEYFLFLGRIGKYSNEQDRIADLRKEVAAIENGRVAR